MILTWQLSSQLNILKLNWSEQIFAVCRKASGTLGHSYSATWASALKENCIKTVPVLEYRCRVWDPHQANLREELQLVQCRSTKFVTGNHAMESPIHRNSRLFNMNRLNFPVPHSNVDSHLHSFFPNTIRLWNALPEQAQAIQSYDSKPYVSTFSLN